MLHKKLKIDFCQRHFEYFPLFYQYSENHRKKAIQMKNLDWIWGLRSVSFKCSYKNVKKSTALKNIVSHSIVVKANSTNTDFYSYYVNVIC